MLTPIAMTVEDNHLRMLGTRRPMPAGSQVPCISCRQMFPLSGVDIVGQGYRCTRCSQQAEIATLYDGTSQAHSHLTPRERQGLHTRGTTALWIGLAALLAGIAICVLLLVIAAGKTTDADASDARKIILYIGVPIIGFAIGSIVTGQRWRSAAR